MENDALVDAVKKVRRLYGDAVVTNLIDDVWASIPSISTGLYSLDRIIGCGGIPFGRITEIYGRESVGKSLLAEQISKQAQQLGTVLWLDFEASIDKAWLTKLGIEIGAKFLVIRPDTMEEGFSIAMEFINTNQISLVVFDSVGAMLPKTTKDREAGDSRPGSVSLPLSICLSQFLPILKTKRTAAIFINHLRANITTYGGGDITAGGNALKYYKHLAIEMRRKAMIKAGDNPVGMDLIARVTKNKVGPPWGQVDLKLKFDSGFDVMDSLLSLLLSTGVATRGSSGWLKAEALGLNERGRDAFFLALNSSPEASKKLVALLPGLVRKPLEPGETKAVLTEATDPVISSTEFDSE